MALKIVVVGAGIAGLSAAITLRRSGHEVHLYERSSMNNEVGAAINVLPNAICFLALWGLGTPLVLYLSNCSLTSYILSGHQSSPCLLQMYIIDPPAILLALPPWRLPLAAPSCCACCRRTLFRKSTVLPSSQDPRSPIHHALSSRIISTSQWANISRAN